MLYRKKSWIEEIIKHSPIFAVKKLEKEKLEIFWEGVKEVLSDSETLKEILLHRNKILNVLKDTLGYSQTKELIFNNFKDKIFFHIIKTRYESFSNIWDRLPVVLNTENDVRIREMLAQWNHLGQTWLLTWQNVNSVMCWHFAFSYSKAVLRKLRNFNSLLISKVLAFLFL